jgi:hypothetical protein
VEWKDIDFPADAAHPDGEMDVIVKRTSVRD